MMKPKYLVPILVALIAAGGTIAVAIINNHHSSSSIPSLNSSYSGTMTRFDGKTFHLQISQLSEDSSGNFTASGELGGCAATFSGSATPSRTINFTATQTFSAVCTSGTYEFSGTVDTNNSLSGRWNVLNSSTTGTWEAS